MSIDLIYFHKQIETELLRLNDSLVHARTDAASTVMLDQSTCWSASAHECHAAAERWRKGCLSACK
jgi:hypothetical protein